MCGIDWTAIGTWALVAVGASAAYFAYQTAKSAIEALRVSRASTDTEAFLKASEIVDDEEKFGPNYDLVRKNAPRLQHASLREAGTTLRGIEGSYDPALPNAVQDVLSALEKVGVIFHYTTTREVRWGPSAAARVGYTNITKR